MKSGFANNDTGFFDKVYDVARLIPFGRVSTYGAIASYIGSPQAARMVGWAMNKCDSEKEYVPAHRVVNRIGLLTGKHFFHGENIMKELLENEGVIIEDDKVRDFDKLFWNPSVELTYSMDN